MPDFDHATMQTQIRRLLRPRSVAIVGASAESREVLRTMLERHPDVGQAVVVPVDDEIKGTIEFNVGEEPGTELGDNTRVATIRTLRDEYPVVAPHGGVIVEWLVTDGDPVNPGQPLLRLHPRAGA